MSDHTIVIIWVLKVFFVHSSVYLCHLVLISSASVRSISNISVLYCSHLCMKCSLGVSNFLEEISSLSHSVVFLYFFALITEEGLSFLAILWNSAFNWVYLSFSPLLFASLLFTAICKASSDNHFAFLHFFFLGMVLILSPIQCHEPLSIVHQALCLLSLVP